MVRKVILCLMIVSFLNEVAIAQDIFFQPINPLGINPKNPTYRQLPVYSPMEMGPAQQDGIFNYNTQQPFSQQGLPYNPGGSQQTFQNQQYPMQPPMMLQPGQQSPGAGPFQQGGVTPPVIGQAPGQQSPWASGQNQPGVPGQLQPGQLQQQPSFQQYPPGPNQALPGLGSQYPQAPGVPGQMPQLPQGPGNTLPGTAQQFLQQVPATSQQYPAGAGGDSSQSSAAQQQARPGLQQMPSILQDDLSDFEKYVAGKSPLQLSFDIKQFGYDLFIKTDSQNATGSQMPGLQMPIQLNTPVGPDYVIGPGDQLRVNVWGSIEGAWPLIVDRDGTITLPKIGSIGVTGLTFQQMKDTVYKELTKHYNDFELNVTMGQLRSQRIFIVGKAKKPGALTVSSLSTLMNALYEAGGPSKVGSMRDVQLKRNGQVITHLDLYDFLLTGSRKGDVCLMPEDVIFIPGIGPMVGIAGNVQSPAIYELKGPTKVSDLIKLAGGASAKAYTQKVQVERITHKQNKMILDLNLDRLRGKDDMLLENGDIVKIFPISPKVTNKVVLKGNVWRPGEYEWRQGMRVKDLIRSTDDLLPESFMERAQIDRLVPPDYHMEYRTFNLAKALINGDEQENMLLEPYDTVLVFNKWAVKPKELVRTEGALNMPGIHDFRPNMKLSDLISLAGGLQSFANTSMAELTRVTPTPEGPKTEKLIVDPEKALSGDPEANIPLQENDYLFVRTIPEWSLYRTVRIAGEVKFPGTYSVAKGEKLSSVLSRAGGFTNTAYLRGAIFTRASVQRVQQEQIKLMVERLQNELMSSGASDMASASSSDEAKILDQQNKQKQQFLDNLKRVQAKGRMIIALDQLPKLKSSAEDYELEDGDWLQIPTNPQSIQVIGAVYNQTGIFFESGKDYNHYIQMAGGYTPNADKKNTYILKADGRAVHPKGSTVWNKSLHQWSVGYGQMDPGDTIIVPDKLDKIPWMRNIKDISQIMFQVATTAAVAIFH